MGFGVGVGVGVRVGVGVGVINMENQTLYNQKQSEVEGEKP